ncbi:hypothetical protein [Streptomyces cuspidosporus]|uniref:Uncharacterized protein n=1 Tax=Streptomyces cuspidosporus TaxID=66882 RepID=A0ABN3GVA8_9ACTN
MNTGPVARSAGCALEDDGPAVESGAGPDVDDMVGVGGHALVVLDENEGCPGVDEVVDERE